MTCSGPDAGVTVAAQPCGQALTRWARCPSMQGEATAVDTPFSECGEEECTVLLDDEQVELQRVTVQVPNDSDVTGASGQRAYKPSCPHAIAGYRDP